VKIFSIAIIVKIKLHGKKGQNKITLQKVGKPSWKMLNTFQILFGAKSG
jgi:hypothetical protein